MKKSIINLFIMIIFINIVVFGQQLHKEGLLFEDITKIPSIKKAEPKTILPKLASYVDNSAHLPPVGDQGSQGSCVAWAVGYYYKTYQEWQEHGWDVTEPDHIFSPSFIYNHINGGHDGGSYFSDALKVLTDNGCANIAEFPYNQSECTTWPSEAVYLDAIKYRADTAYYVQTNDLTALAQVKQILAAGNVAILGINVFRNFENISDFNNTYCVKDTSGNILGGHGVTLIGYDDNKPTADGTGAFRLVNQWGTNWGDSGFFWMSYKAVMDSIVSQRCVFYTSDKIQYKPVIAAAVQIFHPNRNTLKLNFGIGNDTVPKYSKNYFDFAINTIHGLPAIPYPNNKIVFDLTDGLNFIDTTKDNNIFLEAASSDTGTVNSFSVTDLRVPYTINSTETPNSLLVNNKTFTALDFKVVKSNIVSANISLLKGWNLISVPLITANMSSNIVFAGANSPIYNYTNQYNVAGTLGNGNGYWVSYPDTATLTINGSIVNSTSIPINEGWNLIGVYECNVTIDQIMTSPWSIINSPFYGYENNYGIPTILQVGKGYWVRASGPGVMNIGNALAKARSQTFVKQNIDPKWIAITITDNKRNHKTIYAVLESINFDNYVLPPIAPNKIFDIRWSSNQLVDNINAGSKNILINSAEYPVTLEVGGGDLNIQDAAGGKVLNEIVKSGKSITITNPGINELTVKLFAAPTMFELAQNYPNPFNPSTVISWQLAVGSFVTLKVYDVLGREVKTLVNETEPAGKYSVTFNAARLSNGVYFYRIQAGNFVDTKKLIIMK